MGILIIDELARLRASELLAFASQEQNIYRPGPGVDPPGYDPRHVMTLGDFRVVFSITQDPSNGVQFKHLSIGQRNGLLPHLDAVEEVIKLFGFVGGLLRSEAAVNIADKCLVVIQPHQLVFS